MPIYNDTYVMLFFGLLKKLVSKWLTTDANQVSKTLDSSEREKCTAHSDTRIGHIFLKHKLPVSV